MTDREALIRFEEHIRIHQIKEPRANNITEALNKAKRALEAQKSEDCINREAVIKTIFEKCSGENLDIDFAKVLLLQRAIKDIPPATPQTSWILVSERLPEANGRYYVTRGLNACGALWNRVYIANYSDLMGIKSERIWWNGNVSKSDFEQFDDVLAWLPLPEPYKEKQE